MSATIHTIETPGLGDRSYLVHDGASAFVVDPPRDIDRVLVIANDDGVSIEKIFETHVHNDYVSGGLALRRRTGAEIVANRDDRYTFEIHGVTDRDTVDVGPRRRAARPRSHPQPPLLCPPRGRVHSSGVYRGVASLRDRRPDRSARPRGERAAHPTAVGDRASTRRRAAPRRSRSTRPTASGASAPPRPVPIVTPERSPMSSATPPSPPTISIGSSESSWTGSPTTPPTTPTWIRSTGPASASPTCPRR